MFLRLLLIITIILAMGSCGSSLDKQLHIIEELPLEQRIVQLEKLWAEHPDNAELPTLLSRAKWETYVEFGPEEKVERLKADLRADPENAVLSKLLGDTYYDLSQESGREGYIDSALFAYENAALKAPSFLGAVGSVGALYDTREEFDQAIFWYERALSIDPDHVTTLCNIGASHYNKGDYPQAIDYYRHALTVDPNSQDAHYNLGVAFAEASIYREAICEWETVVAIDSTSSVAKQAKQNADLLRDVLEETRYRGGKRTRQIDMSNAVKRSSSDPGTPRSKEAEPDK